MKKTVLIGVTSGIAAYKVLDLIGLLKKEGREVQVMMTEHAARMVPEAEFAKASGNAVYTKLYREDFDYKTVLQKRVVDHIELADSTAVLVVVPATANCIAKLAHGIADDFLTTTALAVTSPILICPSMNVNMWHNPLLQENIERLRKSGYLIIEPTEGMLACGYSGKGRLENVEIIKQEIGRQLRRTSSLAGKKVIVTAGGTRENIDKVRFIANRSSGKMGVAIAEECFLRGANVLLLRAKSAVTPHYQIKQETFETTEELFELVRNNVKEYDILFHAAAVSDFTIENPVEVKLSSEHPIVLKLKPQIKILDQIKRLNPNIQLIAFKAEHGLAEKELIKKAHQRLQESNADVIVANDISQSDRGFESDTNEVFVVLADGTHKVIPLSAKTVVASQIVSLLFD